jgi:hypothetical protein
MMGVRATAMLLLGALSVTVGACALPQNAGLPSGQGTASVPLSQDTQFVPITGPHVWPNGMNAFDTATYSVADDYELILRFPGSAARRVDYCYHRTWNDPLYRRECVAPDYMVHRDRRFHARARLAAQDPYFEQSTYVARMARDIHGLASRMRMLW